MRQTTIKRNQQGHAATIIVVLLVVVIVAVVGFLVLHKSNKSTTTSNGATSSSSQAAPAVTDKTVTDITFSGDTKAKNPEKFNAQELSDNNATLDKYTNSNPFFTIEGGYHVGGDANNTVFLEWGKTLQSNTATAFSQYLTNATKGNGAAVAISNKQTRSFKSSDNTTLSLDCFDISAASQSFYGSVCAGSNKNSTVTLQSTSTSSQAVATSNLTSALSDATLTVQ